jgi:hypothetical protein
VRTIETARDDERERPFEVRIRVAVRWAPAIKRRSRAIHAAQTRTATALVHGQHVVAVLDQPRNDRTVLGPRVGTRLVKQKHDRRALVTGRVQISVNVYAIGGLKHHFFGLGRLCGRGPRHDQSDRRDRQDQ